MIKRALFKLLKPYIQVFKKHLGVDEEKIKIFTGQATVIASKSAHSKYKNLSDASFSIFSQWGEDGILDYLCDVLDIARPKVLELGAGNFHECNSRFLAEFRSADVVPVDAREDLISSVSKLSVYWKNHIYPIQTWITPESIKTIQATANEKIGFFNILSLDLDGNDYWVAKEIDYSNVEIIVVEYNPIFGHKRAITILENENFDRTEAHYTWDYYGASLLAWVNLFQSHNFSFIGSNLQGTNAFFIKTNNTSKLNFLISNDYEMYVNCPTRDARDKAGKMSYRSFAQRKQDIYGLEVFDLISSKRLILTDQTH